MTTRPPPRHYRYRAAVPAEELAAERNQPLPPSQRPAPAHPPRPRVAFGRGTLTAKPPPVPAVLADRIAAQLAADEYVCTWRQNATRCMERAGTVVALADVPRSTCRRHALPFRRLGASPLR